MTGLTKLIVPQCDSIEVAPFVLDILFFFFIAGGATPKVNQFCFPMELYVSMSRVTF